MLLPVVWIQLSPCLCQIQRYKLYKDRKIPQKGEQNRKTTAYSMNKSLQIHCNFVDIVTKLIEHLIYSYHVPCVILLFDSLSFVFYPYIFKMLPVQTLKIWLCLILVLNTHETKTLILFLAANNKISNFAFLNILFSNVLLLLLYIHNDRVKPE